MRALILAVATLVVQSPALLSQGLPRTSPEMEGLSTHRLERIEPVMEDYIKRGIFPGMTVAVARGGQLVYFESFGYADIQTRKPVAQDSIFRIYSMTKPVTATAVMILFEEGKFMLDEPVSKYIPSFKNVKVYRPEGSAESTEPSREITIRDLLRQTSGLGYGWEDDPVSQAYREANLFDPDTTLEQMVDKLTRLPLYFDPGAQWKYSVAIDVLGRLVEIWSGQTLADFFRQRIFEPLDMRDTAFSVPADKVNRFTNCYRFTEEGRLEPLPNAFSSYSPENKHLYSGGGGLVSTASDYLRFAQMLANGGELEGVRILGPKTIELMSMNQLPDGVTAPWEKLQGHGYGFAMSVLTDIAKSLTVGSVGDFGWDGAASTYFRIDPSENLVILLMTHRQPCDTEIQVKLKTLVYQALTD